MRTRFHARGFTVIELMIVVAVAAILVTVAAPSFRSLFDRQRVRSAASNLNVDIQYARSESVRRNEPITVNFSATSTPWCYGITGGSSACDCNTAGSCSVKTVRGEEYTNITMTLAGGSGFTVNPRQGQILAIAGGGSGPATTAITFTSTTTTGAQLQSRLNALGRVSPCAPGGTLPGYVPC